MIFKLGELFCGPGGIGLGAQEAALNINGSKYAVHHSFALDIDKDSCATYFSNIGSKENTMMLCEDISGFNLETLPYIDALAFGFPCNDFSVVGEQKGLNGIYGGLFQYGKKVIDIKKPKWFLAENVGGLRNANDGQAFEHVLNSLQNAGNGYELTVHLYKFEEYGVPQKRHRIIIVGIEKTLNLKFKVPSPTTLKNPVSAKEAIENPPILQNISNNEFTKQSHTVVERLKHIPEGKNAWCEEIPPHLRLNVKGARLSQIYRRLKSDEPAYTLTGSGGGGTHTYHWSEPRALTNRERARLQTFPDWFIFEGSKESVRKQIGMAVPPKGIKIIVESIFKTFANVDYDFVSPHWEMESEVCV